MGSLTFLPSGNAPRLKNFEGDFLSFEGFKKNRAGKTVKSWWELDQDEGAFGEISWNQEGNKIFKTSRDDHNTYLVISSNSDSLRKPVDFSKLFENLNVALSSMENDAQKLMEHVPGKTLDDVQALFKKLAPKKSTSVVLLNQLSPSPDNEYIACIANIYRKGSIGFGGQIYGVIIPLKNDALIAYPFSKNVYHKILWSEDSQRIYYYAQPSAGGGNGTIYRLSLSMN